MNANQAGKFAEDVLAATLRGVGFEFERQRVIGRTIYGGEFRVDFLVRNCPLYPTGLVIESKWQRRNGTADEKFPYVYENLRSCCPYPAIVVVHGGGCRDGALRWLQQRCDAEHLIAVFRLEEFMSWLLALSTIPASR